MADLKGIDISGATKITNEDESLFVDVTPKANGKVGLEVVAEIVGEASTFPSCPVLPNTTKIDYFDTGISLENQNGSFVEIFGNTGKGKLCEFHIDFDNDNIVLRIEVDGNLVTEMDVGFLQSMAPSTPDGGPDFRLGFISMSKSSDVVMFKPSCPIKYATSFSVSARANSNNNNRDADRGWVAYTDE